MFELIKQHFPEDSILGSILVDTTDFFSIQNQEISAICLTTRPHTTEYISQLTYSPGNTLPTIRVEYIPRSLREGKQDGSYMRAYDLNFKFNSNVFDTLPSFNAILAYLMKINPNHKFVKENDINKLTEEDISEVITKEIQFALEEQKVKSTNSYFIEAINEYKKRYNIPLKQYQKNLRAENIAKFIMIAFSFTIIGLIIGYIMFRKAKTKNKNFLNSLPGPVGKQPGVKDYILNQNKLTQNSVQDNAFVREPKCAEKFDQCSTYCNGLTEQIGSKGLHLLYNASEIACLSNVNPQDAAINSWQHCVPSAKNFK